MLTALNPSNSDRLFVRRSRLGNVTRIATAVIALAWPCVVAAQEAPEPVGTMEDIVLFVGGDSALVPFEEAFSDVPLMACVVSSADETVATVQKEDGFNALVIPGQPGTTTITITVSNNAGEATQTFMVEVRNVEPGAGDPIPDQELFVDESRNLDLSSHFSGTNLTFAISLSGGEASGTVSGTTLTITGVRAGTVTATATATNDQGTVEQTFTITVRDVAPEVVSPLPDIELFVGESHVIDLGPHFSGSALDFTATTPDSAASLTLSGQVLTVLGVEAGQAIVTVTATNSEGEAGDEFTVTVKDVPPEVVSPLPDMVLFVGETDTVDVAGAFTGTALTYSVSVADPFASVSLDGSSLTVEGLAAGVTGVTVTATNASGKVTDTFTVTVRDVAPSVGELADLTLYVGDSETVDLDAAFAGSALTFTATPTDSVIASVSIDAASATVTGIAVGVTPVTVTAENSEGSATAAFRVTVVDRPPEAVGQIPDMVIPLGERRTVDLPSYFGGTSLSYSATSASEPVGVSIEDDTLVLDANALGMSRIRVTASNTAGTATQSFNVTVVGPPGLADGIPDMTLCVGGESMHVDLTHHFTGSGLVFSVTSSNTEATVTTLVGAMLDVAPGLEGVSTVTVTAANAYAQVTTTFTALVATDPVELASVELGLAAIGRGILASATNAVSGRFAMRTAASVPAANERNPGLRLGVPTSSVALGLPRRTFNPEALPVHGFANGRPTDHRPPLAQLGFVGPGSFAFQVDAAGKKWTYWGQADVQRLEGGQRGADYEGTLTSVYLGTDANYGDSWQAGVSASRSVAELDLRFESAKTSGTAVLETELVSVYPYLRIDLDRGHLWGMAGAGWGEATLLRSTAGRRQDADLSMWMMAVGGRHRLTGPGSEASVALVEDLAVLRLITDGGVGPINDRSATVSRARLGVDVSGRLVLADGLALSPFAELMARSDSRDGETGNGVELSAGVRYRNESLRIGFEARGHALLTHSSDSYEEQGLALVVGVFPCPDGTGLSMSLNPRWGVADGFPGWEDAFLGDFGTARTAARRGWSMDTRLGYGFRMRRASGVVTTFAEFDTARDMPRNGGPATDQDISLGVRFDLGASASESLSAELSVGRRDRIDGPETRVMLALDIRF